MAATCESALFEIRQKLEDPIFQDFSENGHLYGGLEDFGISSLFDDIPITQMERDLTDYDHLYSSLSIEPNQYFQLPPLQDLNDDDVYCNGLGSVLNDNNEKKQALPLMCCNNKNNISGESEGVDDNSGRSSKMVLSREVLSKYFYMPITKAARELKVGLTILKKRCRELGIRRWPHRKLKSLNALINNIEAGEEREETKREWIKELERERRMIEQIPDVQMQKQTKRLRQSCFKDNYRKKKRMSMAMPNVAHHQPSNPSTSTSTSVSAENVEAATYYNNYSSCEEYEELRCLLSSPDLIMF